jgi:16S rRNA G966 N2-methylase RsmD
MDLNIITRIFPHTENYHLLLYDLEGLYSITLPNEAEEISSLINGLLGYNILICDATAGIGGNTISFSKNFKSVISIELCKNRFKMLENNIQIYELKNVNLINDSCLNKLNLECEAYFFDPPWGGPDYKNKKNIKFKIGDYTLIEIINMIKNNGNKIIFFKLPNNYDLNEFNKFNYNINKIKKYQIITIF